MNALEVIGTCFAGFLICLALVIGALRWYESLGPRQKTAAKTPMSDEQFQAERAHMRRTFWCALLWCTLLGAGRFFGPDWMQPFVQFAAGLTVLWGGIHLATRLLPFAGELQRRSGGGR